MANLATDFAFTSKSDFADSAKIDDFGWNLDSGLTVDAQAGNDTITGIGVFGIGVSGIENSGTINTGSGNDTITGTGSGDNGIENSGTINTGKRQRHHHRHRPLRHYQ
jgi:PPE-repeat protein